MTAGELVKILSQFDPNRRVVVDTGYGITEPDVTLVNDDHFLRGLSTREEQDFILITKKR